MSKVLAVVGSANLDLVITVQHRSAPGETRFGDTFSEHLGGKGLNQALAASDIVATHFIGSVGGDDAADRIRSLLRSAGVGAHYLDSSPSATGRAVVTVTPDGENAITVIPGANADLGVDFVRRALDEINPTAVLVQQEVPAAVVDAVGEWCDEQRVRLVLNPSPARPLHPRTLQAADPVVLNQHEAAELCGETGAPEDLLTRLSARCTSVVITLGRHGAVAADMHDRWHEPGRSVEVRDTTGAGDALVGTLAAHLASGDDLRTALNAGTQVAADLIRFARHERAAGHHDHQPTDKDVP